jgi:hypothetical protein
MDKDEKAITNNEETSAQVNETTDEKVKFI